jgi:protein required for attachment to host cells
MADKLIILTDLGSLKAYRLIRDELSSTPRLELTESFDTLDAHGRLADKVTDMAGRFPVAAGAGPAVAASNGENHNLKTELQRRVIRQLAESVDRLVKQQKPPIWFFAAPKEINRQIVDQLDTDVRSRMKKNVGADLIKVDKSDVMGYFA